MPQHHMMNIRDLWAVLQDFLFIFILITEFVGLSGHSHKHAVQTFISCYQQAVA